jgi:putative aldouronate transport system substrate-binding protein
MGCGFLNLRRAPKGRRFLSSGLGSTGVLTPDYIYQTFLKEKIMKTMRVVLAAVFVLWLVSGAVFAGGRGQTGSSGALGSATSNVNADPNFWKAKYPQPVTVYIGRDPGSPAYPAGVDYENNAWTKYIKDTYNIEVKAKFLVTGDDFTQRVTLAIASNDLPDLLLLNNRLQLNQLMISGMIEDLTGLFDNYASPLFKAEAKTYGDTLDKSMYTTFYDGKQYAISDLYLGAQDALFWVREDWRLKLGLPEPKTTQDFVNLAKAFVDNDMAGKGMTVGIEVQNQIAGNYNGVALLDPYFNEAGAYPRQWYDDGSGKLVYGSVAPQAKEALRSLRDMYAKKIIPQDFATRDWQASLASGYPGVVIGPWWIPIWPLNYTVQNDPNAIWQVYNWKGSRTGKFHSYQQNWNTMWGVIRKGYAHPEVLIKLLNASCENQVTFDGESMTDDQKKQYDLIIPQSVNDAYKGTAGLTWGYWPTNLALRFNDMVLMLANIQKTFVDRYKAGDRNFDSVSANVISNIVKYENRDRSFAPWMDYQRYMGMQIEAQEFKTMDIKPIFYPYTTETMELRWSNLQDLENDSYYKIIMGTEPLDYFDTFVRQWSDQGGTRITTEVNTQYKK